MLGATATNLLFSLFYWFLAENNLLGFHCDNPRKNRKTNRKTENKNANPQPEYNNYYHHRNHRLRGGLTRTGKTEKSPHLTSAGFFFTDFFNELSSTNEIQESIRNASVEIWRDLSSKRGTLLACRGHHGKQCTSGTGCHGVIRAGQNYQPSGRDD